MTDTPPEGTEESISIETNLGPYERIKYSVIDLARPNLFKVDFSIVADRSPMATKINNSYKSSSFAPSAVEFISLKRMGVIYNIPVNRTFGSELTMTFHQDVDGIVRAFFEAWIENAEFNFDFQRIVWTSDTKTKKIIITQLNSNMENTFQQTFNDVHISTISEIPLGFYDEHNSEEFTVSFKYLNHELHAIGKPSVVDKEGFTSVTPTGI